MKRARGRRSVDARLVVLVCALAGCGSSASGPRDGGSPSPDGAASDGAPSDGPSPGMCASDLPAGQACNTLQNMETPLTPTCVSGTMPAGTGGVIFDGTYILTSQTYYNVASCSNLALAETISIAGDCIQLVFGDILSGTASGRLAANGNMISFTTTCEHVDNDASFTQNASAQTYTATGTTFTLFTVRTAAGGSATGDVAVFTKR